MAISYAKWFDVHPADDHDQHQHVAAGFVMLACDTCGVLQSAEEVAAGVEVAR
jgi:acyl-coenzyme A thioesterase PaaI-like protein